MAKFCLLVVYLLPLLGHGKGFLELPEGQRFLRSYCNALRYSSVNIFLPSSGEVTLSPGVLRALWTGSVRSVSVGRINTKLRAMDDLLASSLNVGYVLDASDLQFFTRITNQQLIREYQWLLLGNATSVLEASVNPYLIIDNQVTFASFNNATKAVQLLEAYSVASNLPPNIQSLGKWTEEGNQLSITTTSWVQRRSNLTGLYLRCTTMPQSPFLYIDEPDTELNVRIKGGYAGDVWHTLQNNLGFTYTCKQPADGLWGNPTDGVWNGLVKDLLDGNADVVVTSLDHSSARVGVVDFLNGIKEVGYQLVVRRPGLMERTWTSFTTELVPASWMATIAFAILAPPFLCICSKYSPNESEKISLKDAYILTIGAFTVQGSWLEVRSMSTRIVFITIFFTTLLVYAHYTSALVSLLTVKSTTTQITSLQDLLDDGTYSFGFVRDTAIQNGFEGAQMGLFRNIWKQLVGDPSNLPRTDAEGVEWVTTTNYVHMVEENLYRAEFSSMCSTIMIKGKYFTQQTGFAVPKDSPLQKIFNSQLMRMRDGGVLSRLWEQWQPPPPLCTGDSVVALNIQQLFTAFLLLVLGIALAVIFLPCERLHWHVFGKEKILKSIKDHAGKESSDNRFFYSRSTDSTSQSLQGQPDTPYRTIFGLRYFTNGQISSLKISSCL